MKRLSDIVTRSVRYWCAGILILCLCSCAGKYEVNIDDAPEITDVMCKATSSQILLNARFSGNADMVSECGFMFGPTGSDSERFEVPKSENSFSLMIDDFDFDSEYRVVAYISNGRNVIYSPKYIVRTPKPEEKEPDEPEVPQIPQEDWSSSVDLSVSGTANCYIVSQSGSYKFRPTQGCSETSVGDVVAVEVLWETFGTAETPDVGQLVKTVAYEDEYICFKVPDPYLEGNAVIAAKDKSGTILWSWHVWLTDQPSEQIYYNDAGILMDRNLGATSAAAGEVGALGLLYQWGRKDPFIGSSSISESINACSTIEWPSSLRADKSIGTIEYSIKHPTTCIKSEYINKDWVWTGTEERDMTRWSTSDKPKTIYDPCPSGWRVPDGGNAGVWAKALGLSTNIDMVTDPVVKGIDFSGIFGPDLSIWYPAAGALSDGTLLSAGLAAYYWSATSGPTSAYRLLFSNKVSIKLDHTGGAALAASVRCVRD